MRGQWLFEEDDYSPLKEREGFIEKNLNLFVRLIEEIRKTEYEDSLLSRVGSEIKILFTLLFIFKISTAGSFKILLILNGGLVINFLLAGKDTKRSIILRVVLITGLSGIMLLPNIIFSHLRGNLFLLIKVFSTIFALNTTVFNTKWNEILDSLSLFKIPDTLIWILHITLKHIVSLSHRSLNLLISMKMRSIGRNSERIKNISNIIGNLFLSSVDSSQEMSAAMECRGFTGEYSPERRRHINDLDWYYATFNLCVLTLSIITSI